MHAECQNSTVNPSVLNGIMDRNWRIDLDLAESRREIRQWQESEGSRHAARCDDDASVPTAPMAAERQPIRHLPDGRQVRIDAPVNASRPAKQAVSNDVGSTRPLPAREDAPNPAGSLVLILFLELLAMTAVMILLLVEAQSSPHLLKYVFLTMLVGSGTILLTLLWGLEPMESEEREIISRQASSAHSNRSVPASDLHRRN